MTFEDFMHAAVELFEAVGVLVLVLGGLAAFGIGLRDRLRGKSAVPDGPTQPGAGDPVGPGDPDRRGHHSDDHDRINSPRAQSPSASSSLSGRS